MRWSLKSLRGLRVHRPRGQLHSQTEGPQRQVVKEQNYPVDENRTGRNATTTDLTNTNTYHLNSASRRRGPQCVLCICHGGEKEKSGLGTALCTQNLNATVSIGVQCSILCVYTRGKLKEDQIPSIHTALTWSFYDVGCSSDGSF